jgi:hypothetical protein
METNELNQGRGGRAGLAGKASLHDCGLKNTVRLETKAKKAKAEDRTNISWAKAWTTEEEGRI